MFYVWSLKVLEFDFDIWARTMFFTLKNLLATSFPKLNMGPRLKSGRKTALSWRELRPNCSDFR